MTAELEYTGLMALAWDPLRGDTSGWEDRALFLDLIGELGQPVLDTATISTLGYERGDGLAAMVALGFRSVGPLRVWISPT